MCVINLQENAINKILTWKIENREYITWNSWKSRVSASQYFTLTIDGVHCEKRSKKQVIFFFSSGGRLGCGRTGLGVYHSLVPTLCPLYLSSQLAPRQTQPRLRWPVPYCQPAFSISHLKTTIRVYDGYGYVTTKCICCVLYWLEGGTNQVYKWIV